MHQPSYTLSTYAYCRRRDGPTVEEVKTSSPSPSVHVDVDVGAGAHDDFERAEGKFFHAVENIEKKAINVAHSLIHDEVDVLFGKDHGHHHDENGHQNENSMHINDDDHMFHLPIFGGRRRGSSSGSGSESIVKNQAHQISATDCSDESDEKLLNFMENYAENCFNPHGGW